MVVMKRQALLLLGCLPWLLSCGDDAPVALAGQYTIALTNESDSCNNPNFTVGQTTMNIPLVITQDDNRVTADVGRPVAGVLDLVLGGHVYTGEVHGSSFSLTLFGTRSATMGNCTFTINSTIDGSLDGDLIMGDVTHRPADNGNPDCTAVATCATVQRFNGTRPPTL